MAPDAAVAYHTALESHGYAQSLFERLTFVTWTKAKPTAFQGRLFIAGSPARATAHRDQGRALDRAGGTVGGRVSA